MSAELAFDITKYKNSPEESLAEDMAGMSSELADKPLEERINPRRFKIISRKIFDPKTGKEVPGEMREDTEFDKREAAAARAFYKHVLAYPAGSVVIGFSPRGGDSPYKDSRINVVYKSGEEDLEFYGVVTTLSPSLLMYRAIRLSEFSSENIIINSPANLRDKVIPVALKENPWKFLQAHMSIDSQAWQEIADGKPWLRKEEALEKTRQIASMVTPMLGKARTELEFIKIGAWAERRMQEMGLQINFRNCPGLFNLELLALTQQNYLIKDNFGNWRIAETKWKYHKGNCKTCPRKNVDVGPCNICKVCEREKFGKNDWSFN